VQELAFGKPSEQGEIVDLGSKTIGVYIQK
jgi:hypothetical protein